MNLNPLLEIASEAALKAGKQIEQFQKDELQLQFKKGGESLASQVLTEADQAAEAIITEHLSPSRKDFDLGLLSEEREDDRSRFEKEAFWCIDPLDGTLPFIEQRGGYSVSIALVSRKGQALIGVIYDPQKEILYQAALGLGAFRNGQAWQPSKRQNWLSYITDKKLGDTPKVEMLREIITEQRQALGLKEYREIAGGGAALNAMKVLEEAPALMLKLPKPEAGGGSIWDFAASACIFQEVGGRASNFYGAALDLNRADGSFMNHQGVFFSFY